MRQKELLVISITVFLTLIAWIAADLYHITTVERIKISDIRSSEPINVKIDVKLFDSLEMKR